jgi:hypothetical protein
MARRKGGRVVAILKEVTIRVESEVIGGAQKFSLTPKGFGHPNELLGLLLAACNEVLGHSNQVMMKDQVKETMKAELESLMPNGVVRIGN